MEKKAEERYPTRAEVLRNPDGTLLAFEELCDIVDKNKELQTAFIAGWQEGLKGDEDVYRFTRQQFVKFIEWCRVNGERHRGNLQKNGIELYDQYLKETK